MSPPSAIVLDTQAWSDLCYHVLAHVDLGEDAANLFDPTLPTTSWAPALHEAYTQRLQWLPLGRSTPDDPALLAPIEAEAERFMTRWQETAQARQALLAAAAERLVPRLSTLRSALWGAVQPPPLRVLHCPSLRHHGRAIPHPDESRTAATSLDRDLDQALCTLFHEECHPVSDPRVSRAGPRSTRAADPGHAVHTALETAAVQLGYDVISQALPELRDAYRQWAGGFGMALSFRSRPRP